MSNWIKTTDRMPEDDKTDVLFMVNPDLIYLGTWNECFKEWWEDSIDPDSFQKEEVIAWCPIPEYDIKD